jgi:hypothetical protein
MKAPSKNRPLLALQSWGVVTAVGHSTGQTLSSLLGGLSGFRYQHLPDVSAEALTCAPCRFALAQGQEQGALRLRPLLQSALAEALERLHLPKSLSAQPGHLLCLLVLPPWANAEVAQQLRQATEQTLAAHPIWPLLARRQTICQQHGSSGAAHALQSAYAALESDPQLQHIVIATADSWVEPSVLERVAREGLVLSRGGAHGPQGFVAGEAAACLVLGPCASVQHLPPGGFVLHRPGLHDNPEPRWPSAIEGDGQALNTAIEHALLQAGLNAEHLSHLASDMDGSGWRVMDELRLQQRALAACTQGPSVLRIAEQLGQTGAAGLPLMWALLAEKEARHIERVNAALTWSLGMDQSTAAVVMERSPRRAARWIPGAPSHG